MTSKAQDRFFGSLVLTFHSWKRWWGRLGTKNQILKQLNSLMKFQCFRNAALWWLDSTATAYVYVFCIDTERVQLTIHTAPFCVESLRPRPTLHLLQTFCSPPSSEFQSRCITAGVLACAFSSQCHSWESAPLALPWIWEPLRVTIPVVLSPNQ